MQRTKVFFVTVFLASYLFSETQFPKNYVAEQIQSLSMEEIHLFKDLESGELVEIDSGLLPLLVYRRTETDISYIDSYVSDYDLHFDKFRSGAMLKAREDERSSISGPIEFALEKFSSEFPISNYRSLDKSYFVAIGMDPEFGCRLRHIDSERYRKSLNAPSEAILINLCHGELYDAAGREITISGKHDTSGKILFVPMYEYINENEIKLNAIDFKDFNAVPEVQYSGLSSQQILWKACKFNDRKAVELSLKNGADPNAYIGNGNVLDCAISYSDREVITLLLDYNARLSAISMDLLEIMSRDDIADLITTGSSDKD